MGNLPRLTLSHNERRDQWEQRHDNSGRLVESFEHKADAIMAGSLSAADTASYQRIGIAKETSTVALRSRHSA
jgi:hypothetical protein